jgi:hypothetical protein
MWLCRVAGGRALWRNNVSAVQRGVFDLSPPLHCLHLYLPLCWISASVAMHKAFSECLVGIEASVVSSVTVLNTTTVILYHMLLGATKRIFAGGKA